MNFRQLDLNLLRVLAAIHRSGSVTAAARTLSLSQSATSNALARLRQFFGDELFVRSPAGLQRTRAVRAGGARRGRAPALAGGAGHRRRGLRCRSTARTTWRLSLSDLGEMLFLPRLTAALRERAPHTRVVSNISVAAPRWPRRWKRARSIAPSASCSRGTAACMADLMFREQYVAITSRRLDTGRGRAAARR